MDKQTAVTFRAKSLGLMGGFAGIFSKKATPKPGYYSLFFCPNYFVQGM